MFENNGAITCSLTFIGNDCPLIWLSRPARTKLALMIYVKTPLSTAKIASRTQAMGDTKYE
jgi:hypothetical protein